MAESLRQLLGLGVNPQELTALQVSVRGILCFGASLVIVRLGNKRFLAKMSPFDVILGFMLASMLARAINGSAAFVPTLVGALVLVSMHSLLATLAFRWRWFGRLVKGRPAVLVQDGKKDERQMRAHKISDEDLLEESRLNGKLLDVASVRRATIERSGEVSIVPAEK